MNRIATYLMPSGDDDPAEFIGCESKPMQVYVVSSRPSRGMAWLAGSAARSVMAVAVVACVLAMLILAIPAGLVFAFLDGDER